MGEREPLHLLVQTLAAQPELTCRRRAVAVVAGQGVCDQQTLEMRHSGPKRTAGLLGEALSCVIASQQPAGQMVGPELLARRRHRKRPLHLVLELPHVARPVVRQEDPLGGWGEATAGPPFRGAVAGEEVARQRQDVLAALPQRCTVFRAIS